MKTFLKIDCYIANVNVNPEPAMGINVNFENEIHPEAEDFELISQYINVEELVCIRETWLDAKDCYAVLLIFTNGEPIYCANRASDIMKTLTDSKEYVFRIVPKNSKI